MGSGDEWTVRGWCHALRDDSRCAGSASGHAYGLQVMRVCGRAGGGGAGAVVRFATLSKMQTAGNRTMRFVGSAGVSLQGPYGAALC